MLQLFFKLRCLNTLPYRIQKERTYVVRSHIFFIFEYLEQAVAMSY
jgi:hypothetical protein